MATFRKRGPRQWQAQVRKKGCPLQTKTLAPHRGGTMGARRGARDGPRRISVPRRSRLHHARRIARALPLKRSRRSRNRRHLRPCVRALLRHPLAQRVVSGIRGVDIARFRDERLRRVSPGTVKWDFVIVAELFEVARQPWGIEVHNPVRDVAPRRTSTARDRPLSAAPEVAVDEELCLLTACRRARHPHLLSVVRSVLETAMRQGELVGLRCEHLDSMR